MSVVDVLQGIASAVVPPPDSDHNANFWWRWRVAIVSCASFFGVIGITCAAFGLMPGFDGFAKAADLQTYIKDGRQHWVYQLDQEILDFRIKQCHAGSEEARQLYQAKIQQLIMEYRNLTQQPYTVPACADI